MSNNFFKDIIDSGDIEALDVYFTYYYDQSAKGGITRHRSEHYYYLKIFCEYNLKVKHSKDYTKEDSKREEKIREEKIKSTLSKFINLTDYRSLLTPEVKGQITEELLRSDIKKRIENLDKLEKKVLYFALSYISLKTQEYFLALDQNEDDYNLDLNMRVRTERENKRNILYYDLTSEVDHHKKWKYIFNLFFDKKLIHGYTIPIYGERMNETIGILRISKKLYAYDLGNIIVKSGLGYWEPWVTGSPNVHLELIIPKFLYDLYDFDDFGNNDQNLPPKPPKPPKFQDFGNRVKEIEKRLNDEMAKEAHFRPPESEITFPFRTRPDGGIIPIRVKWIRF
jgi:hypothetical protein